ncbi:hypothetical protein BC826DRAFT_996351, partial [Russula brevipes]
MRTCALFPIKVRCLQGIWRMIRAISAVYAPDLNSRASHDLCSTPAFDAAHGQNRSHHHTLPCPDHERLGPSHLILYQSPSRLEQSSPYVHVHTSDRTGQGCCPREGGGAGLRRSSMALALERVQFAPFPYHRSLEASEYAFPSVSRIRPVDMYASAPLFDLKKRSSR